MRTLVSVSATKLARCDYQVTVQNPSGKSIRYEISGDAGAAAGAATMHAMRGGGAAIVVGPGDVMQFVPREFGGQK